MKLKPKLQPDMTVAESAARGRAWLEKNDELPDGDRQKQKHGDFYFDMVTSLTKSFAELEKISHSTH